MNPLIDKFLNHMARDKDAGENTLLAYRRDLCKLEGYLSASGGQGIGSATDTALMAYVLHLHKSGLHASTVSRSIAVIKNFYRYLFYEREISRDPARLLRPPRVVRAASQTLSQPDKDKLLDEAPSSNADARTVRDRAITALMLSTQIRVGALTELNLGDIDLAAGLIRSKNARDESKARLEPDVLEPLEAYINTSRPEILRNSATFRFTDKSAPLFVNMNGRRLSRQGLWKIVRDYGRRAQLEVEISPRLLRR